MISHHLMSNRRNKKPIAATPKKHLPKEYALVRCDNRNRHGWIVDIRRRGYLITRYFADDYYDGYDEALIMARSYRNAVMHAFPRYTTIETAQTLSSRNQSGVAGVQQAYRRHGRDVGWMATMQADGKRHQKVFSFDKYGGKAFKKAVEQRMA